MLVSQTKTHLSGTIYEKVFLFASSRAIARAAQALRQLAVNGKLVKVGSIKGEVKKKHFSKAGNFSCFAAHVSLINRFPFVPHFTF
jgi:hypothetical protein